MDVSIPNAIYFTFLMLLTLDQNRISLGAKKALLNHRHGLGIVKVS